MNEASRTTDANGRPPIAARARGLACGLTVGLFETAWVLAAPTHTYSKWYDWTLVLLAAPLLYGMGGWLLGALPIARRFPPAWWCLWLAGAAWLVRARFAGEMHHVLWIGVAGSAIALALFASAHRLSVLGARRLERAFLSVVALAVLSTPLLLRAVTPPPPSDRRPDSPPDRALPNVVLVTWDTVRADSLPLFGGGGLDTPALDRLAKEGALFTQFRAVAPSTAPAHTSMLTGVYPLKHGLRSNGEGAPDLALPRFSSICAEAGFATGGFVSAFVLRHEYGFDRGFHHFDDRGATTPLELVVGRLYFGCLVLQRILPAKILQEGVNTPGELTLARAREWYARTDRPAFLWTHFYDAHFPYTPPEPFRANANARASEGPHAVAPRCEKELVLQRGEIMQLDGLLADLRNALEAKDPGLAHTWIVLLADHGECFGEGGVELAHHNSLFDATQHVFLLIRPPTGATDLPIGVRVDVPSCQVDLLPTLCELLGLAAPADLDGESLVPAWRGLDAAERGFYMEAFQYELGDARMQGWCEHGWKYVRNLSGVERLDPPDVVGARDVAASEPEKLKLLRARLDAFLASEKAAPANSHDRTDEEKRALRQLGYTSEH